MPQLKDLLIVIMADSHVGDRLKELPENLLSQLSAIKPDLILHAGDISVRRVLDQLNQVAPVRAIQGNRDWFLRLPLPVSLDLVLNGVNVTLTHGHISMLHYFRDFIEYFFNAKNLTHRRYQRNIAKRHPKADLIIYGHTHYQVDNEMLCKRFINPGSVYPCRYNKGIPQIGLLHISSEGSIKVEFQGVS